jgi:hypothetical protein
MGRRIPVTSCGLGRVVRTNYEPPLRRAWEVCLGAGMVLRRRLGGDEGVRGRHREIWGTISSREVVVGLGGWFTAQEVWLFVMGGVESAPPD